MKGEYQEARKKKAKEEAEVVTKSPELKSKKGGTRSITLVGASSIEARAAKD